MSGRESLCAFSDPLCVEVLRDAIRRTGSDDVMISTQPPLVESQHPPAELTCPHGVTYYVAPTSEQIAAWAGEDAA